MIELVVGLVVKIFGEVLGRWIQDGERLQIVDHLVIEPLDRLFHDLTQFLEVEQQPGLVQFLAGERNPHLVIVPVRILTLALVIAQVMPGGKRIIYGNFEHEPSWRPVSRTKRGPVPNRILYRDASISTEGGWGCPSSIKTA